MPAVVTALAVSVAVACLGVWRRWLTPLGAATAVPAGLAIALAGWDCAAMLSLFFVSGSLATKFNARVTASRHSAASGGGSSGRSVTLDVTTVAAASAPALVSQDDDAKVGRGALQVIATAGVPAMLCVVQTPVALWHTGVLVYFACCAGDTFASEFGQLSAHKPRLITTFQPVKPGRDGGVSLLGTMASVVGGALIGAVGGTWDAVLLGAFSGWAGSMIDSLLGALLQAPGAAGAMDGATWKAWNCAVNALSSTMTILLVVALEAYPAGWGPLLLLLLVVSLATADAISPFYKRKGLHMATSLLVLSWRAWPRVEAAVAAFTCILTLTKSGRQRLGPFETSGQQRPGIGLYALSVLVAALSGQDMWCVLAPMFFADTAAAVVGGQLVGGPRLYGGKSIVGTVAFVVITYAGYLWAGPTCPFGPRERMLVSLLLGAVELFSGSLDNIAITLCSLAALYLAAGH